MITKDAHPKDSSKFSIGSSRLAGIIRRSKSSQRSNKTKRTLFANNVVGTHARKIVLACSLIPVSSIAQDYPLLDRAEIRSPWMAACEGQSADTPLPVDPRSLVVPGVNVPGGKVAFNAWWVDLHNPEPPWKSVLEPRVTTCGEFLESVERGLDNLKNRAYFQATVTTKMYENIWRSWGLAVRPDDFDEQVVKRYGSFPAPFRNPFPQNGEDPALTDGGSGQMAMGMVVERDSDGNYTGMMSVTCSGCHDSRLGLESESEFYWGRSNDAGDAGLFWADANKNLVTWPLLFAPIPWSTGRGTTDAIGIIDMLPALFDVETLELGPSPFEFFPSHAAGMVKAPNWWYRAFKPRIFWDGALPSDNVRSETAFGVANLRRTAEERRALTVEFEDNDNFFISLSPPPYPKDINIPLAETGALLFHMRNLWADGANADIPRYAGNGSCASCHGVYSPKFANDPSYLSDPRLKGVAGVIVPIETINTDPARVGLMADERKRRAWNTGFLAYNDMSPDHEGFEAPKDIWEWLLHQLARRNYDLGIGPLAAPEGPAKWIEPFGYVAPPLYGAWAAAPYFHNGSVPTIWQVLKPQARPKIWKRRYTEPGFGGVNRGYDYSYASYDFNKLGWKHEELPCQSSASPLLPCTNLMTDVEIKYAELALDKADEASLAYQSPPPISPDQIPARMIYNTYLYSQSNQGHEFTQSLTDEERLAIIEYLKTL